MSKILVTGGAGYIDGFTPWAETSQYYIRNGKL
jgi:hypothetical protein